MKNQYLILKASVQFAYNGELHSLNKKHLSYQKVVDLLKEGNFEEASRVSKSNSTETSGLKVKGNLLTVKGTGVKLGTVYVEAFLHAANEGGASEAILDKFFANVAANPDPVSRDGLSDFLAVNKLPITDRGTFLAYRYVGETFFDCHSGTMDNMIGNDMVMDRNLCDSNPNADCSRGLHVCQHEYMGHAGTYQLVVEVNPRDVVAVPSRYDARKMRVCRFRPLCLLDYFKSQLRIREQAALGKVPVFLTEQTREWDCLTGVPAEFHDRYKPMDAWEWAAK